MTPPEEPLRSALRDLQLLRVSVVPPGSAAARVFNGLLAHEHYLGHRNTVGENLRYLVRDRQGRPAQAFTPDFYLPEYDFYIELTTMSQKLVTKKNRKVRRLKELHPEVNVKILYQKDFRALLARFGVPVLEKAHSQGGGPSR